ncbi:MAG TPA: protein translocase subunit SecD [Actinophytocola sp.]|uniref:protein translocase subunit SecD n=1 Tax=Actinophytocola sp. TaxID=1872138 RepID=UPI002DB8B97C|nr:protein translocase subunit SecD [Actinophytocola sp.]HEU5472856.1 protein translocase subunit SecD [Actinophytocola sp.]
MAPPAGQIRPARYLAFFVFIVVLLYTLVFATGDHQAKPKLGIDLQGGTRVVLTARTETGQDPSKESLDQARSLIETRVNGIGVSGAEVVLDGNQIVITVPGSGGDQAKTLGQTARLHFREVITSTQVQPQQEQQPPPSSSAPPSAPASAANPPSSPAPQGRPAPAAAAQPGTTTPAPGSDTPSTAPSTPPATPPATEPTDPITACQKYKTDLDTHTADVAAKRDSSVETATLITEAKACRQNEFLAPATDGSRQAIPEAQQAAVATLDCSPNHQDPLVGNDDPTKPLVTCDREQPVAYVLGPSFLDGTEIANANSQVDDQGVGYVVTLDFKATGGRVWGDYTTKNVQKQAAFVLDTEVVSAPTIQEPIVGGSTRITGGAGGFSQTESRDLANVLKYGSLPLSFEASEAETVSATLGLASLAAGLIAGAIGLALVFVYCLFYYRALGVLTILSLALSGVIVYAILVLLGRWIGFTLDLAGIAGFIVAIGITADSFIIFFERLKDEIREGRTFRSAVPRAWIRARRTILSADAVSFLAAAVLYLLAVGQVKGFAFTLGMSTVLDLIVVFLVTHPLVVYASKSKFLSGPRLSGLGAMQRMAAANRAALSTAEKGA